MVRVVTLIFVAVAVIWAAAVFLYEPSIGWKIKHYHGLLVLFSTLNVPPWVVDRLVPGVGPHLDQDGVLSSDGKFENVRYRLYVPGEEAHEGNVLVWVHGGGFVLGHIWEFQIDRTCRRLALHAKIRVVSIEYRKAPSHHFHAGSDDVITVVRNVHQLWKPAKMALGGESAGATVALAVALKYPSLFHHLLLVYPGLEHGFDEELIEKGSWIVSKEVIEWFRSHHVIRGVADEHIRETEEFNLLLKEADSHQEQVAHLPPTNLVSAGLDPLTVGVQKLESKMIRSGVRCSHDHYPKAVHGFFCFDLDGSDEAIAKSASKIFRI